MKKFKTLLVSALMVIMCLFALAGCANGTYKFQSIKVNTMGVSMTLNVGDSLPGVGELTEDFMVIELKGGKKAIVMSNGETKEGTWEKGEEKGTIVITIEEESITFVKDGKTLSFTMEGAGQVVLSK